MPDAGGNIRGISLGGKAGEVLDRIKRQEALDEISAIGQEQQEPKHQCHGCQSCWADLMDEQQGEK